MSVDHLVAITIASVPAVFIFLYIYRRWKSSSSVAFFGAHLSAGIAAGALALLLELAIDEPLIRLLPGSFSIFASAFIVAALIEEGVKAIAIKAAIDRAIGHNFTPYDAMGASACVVLGFGAAETALYAATSPAHTVAITLLRYVTAIPLHYLTGMLFAYAYVHANRGVSREVGWMFFVVVVAHGFYDYLLMAPNNPKILIFAVIAGLWAYSIYQGKSMPPRST